MSGLVEARRKWARERISRQTANRPVYGSEDWRRLPDDHPDKFSACVVAAECWAVTGDTLESDLRAEVEGLRAGFKAEEDRAYVAAVQAHREAYPGGGINSHEARRQAQQMAARPRPGDFPGIGRQS